jgi:hypothetical protein
MKIGLLLEGMEQPPHRQSKVLAAKVVETGVPTRLRDQLVFGEIGTPDPETRSELPGPQAEPNWRGKGRETKPGISHGL